MRHVLTFCLFFLSACKAPATPGDGRRVAPEQLVVGRTVEPVRLTSAYVTFPDGFRLKVEVADTAESRERGLMDRTKYGPDEGMLFVFGADQTLGFWMKNTWVDLDMAWLDGDGRVTTLHENVPHSDRAMRDDQVATRSGWGRYVLELPAGQAKRRKVQRGTILKLDLTPEGR